MRRSNKVLLGAGIVVLLLAVGLFYLYSNLDRIVAAAIEKYGAQATGTKVSVSAVHIRLRAGEGSIGGLRVGNPAGFSTPEAITLKNITISVDTSSISGNPIVINRIVVSSPRVVYEVNGSGKSNILEIARHVRGGAEQTKEPTGAQGGNEGVRKVLIRSIVVEKGEVAFRVAALQGKPLSATLPPIVLRNVGGKGGDSPAVIAEQVLVPIARQAAAAASQAGIQRYLGKNAEALQKSLEEKAEKQLGTSGKEAVHGAENTIRELFGK